MHNHIDTQLKKAQTAFRALSNLFHNKYLNHKAKIICYLLLIRPTITYASPIWWNCSASTMEKIRKFERACLRSSLHMYRRYDSVNKPYYSNNALYNRAGIPRIDNYIIKLTRDYMANLANINNNYMSEFASIVRSSAINTAATGYISPHSFMYYDKKQLIQNSNNIPIIYHTVRHKANKALDLNIPDERLSKYSIAIPDVDKHTNHRNKKKYWWLKNDQQRLAIVEGRLADS
ncbi:hypothetical protein TKK_0013878 [Trichogramma kaykai]